MEFVIFLNLVWLWFSGTKNVAKQMSLIACGTQESLGFQSCRMNASVTISHLSMGI